MIYFLLCEWTRTCNICFETTILYSHLLFFCSFVSLKELAKQFELRALQKERDAERAAKEAEEQDVYHLPWVSWFESGSWEAIF